MRAPSVPAGVARVTCLWPLVQTSHFDKDERYMAVNDLTQELQKDVRLDGVLEKRICDAILERLQRDTCNDVQAISVKWCVWAGWRGCSAGTCGERDPAPSLRLSLQPVRAGHARARDPCA